MARPVAVEDERIETRTGNPDIEAALELARRPPKPPPMPGGELRLRLRTSPALRRAVPSRVAVAVAQRRGGRIWERDAEARERALATIEAVVAGTARAHEVESLARAHVIEREIYEELFWQPWPTARTDAESDRHLREAFHCGRGVLVSCCHLGPLFLHLSAITSRGRIPYILSAPWFFAELGPGYWGRRIARWWVEVCRRDERVVCTDGAVPVLAELLRQREVVVIYFDMPGSRATPFLGKEVMLATGTARLAAETDALVLPMRSRLAGTRGWADVGAPLDPRTIGGWEEIHAALARVHETSILELPQTLEDPNRAGAWEGGAGPGGWARADSL
jgi:lauroyl/myristoyl acyltransferase